MLPPCSIGIVAGLRRLRGFRIGRRFVGRLIGGEVFGLDLRLRFGEFVFQFDTVGGAAVFLPILLAAALFCALAGAAFAFAFSGPLALTLTLAALAFALVAAGRAR